MRSQTSVTSQHRMEEPLSRSCSNKTKLLQASRMPSSMLCHFYSSRKKIPRHPWTLSICWAILTHLDMWVKMVKSQTTKCLLKMIKPFKLCYWELMKSFLKIKLILRLSHCCKMLRKRRHWRERLQPCVNKISSLTSWQTSSLSIVQSHPTSFWLERSTPLSRTNSKNWW